ncbi:C40 family peptidase [Cecembia lonarensis]|uniref:Putative endopeptidase Spr n=1 Tax=Cecembia lonarensis (strain CCUG 58316 / KCTC 22772 / LW9) TaxID=1225176 RepID=K1M2P5_CECL9|nr:C40 family peptidase [Cecembia lonarensis]EKB50564.1 putative endopeptidase Spr precursor [Cecembia lonarensis LW9]
MNKGLRENYSKGILGVFFIFALVLALSSCSSTKKIRKQNIEKVIDTAKSYRGTPYRYGGTTRSGIDCSALIFHSYNSIGINLPRTSADQSKVGKNVPARNLQKGDLVFFATGKSRRKVTHSGIVTEVSSRGVYFIHSSTSLGVTEDNLTNPYWNKAFRFGKRIL